LDGLHREDYIRWGTNGNRNSLGIGIRDFLWVIASDEVYLEKIFNFI